MKQFRKIVSFLRNKVPLYWLAGLLCLSYLPVHALAPQPKALYKMTQNLEDQWLIYSTSYNGYVPYFQKQYGVQPTLSLYLNLKRYSHYNLSLQVPKTTHLFIQSQLFRTLQPDAQLVFNIDSLQRLYKLNALLVTLYTPEGHTQLPTATIVYKNQEVSETQKNKGSYPTVSPSRQPQLRELSRFQDFVTVAIVLLLAFYTFLLNYHPKAFQRNFSLHAILTVDTREDATVIAKPLSQINLLFVLAHSMSLGLFYMIAQWYSESFFINVLPLSLSGSFGELMQYFVVCTGALFLLLISKYFFVYAIGVVFGISNAASVHYYEYLLFSRIFFLVIIPLQFVFMLSFPQLLVWFIQTIFVAVIILNVARMFVISSVLNKITSFRNLYLFSYLCATELIPLLIGIKFLAK